MEHLLAIALGPVQEFIATARRTRDLYAGSRLLSEAAARAAEALRKLAELLEQQPDAILRGKRKLENP